MWLVSKFIANLNKYDPKISACNAGSLHWELASALAWHFYTQIRDLFPLNMTQKFTSYMHVTHVSYYNVYGNDQRHAVLARRWPDLENALLKSIGFRCHSCAISLCSFDVERKIMLVPPRVTCVSLWDQCGSCLMSDMSHEHVLKSNISETQRGKQSVFQSNGWQETKCLENSECRWD